MTNKLYARKLCWEIIMREVDRAAEEERGPLDRVHKCQRPKTKTIVGCLHVELELRWYFPSEFICEMVS